MLCSPDVVLFFVMMLHVTLSDLTNLSELWPRPPLTDTNRLTDLFRQEEVVMVTGGGQIHSPRYPNAYPPNLLLSWKLLSAPHTRILLEFDGQFGLEEPENNVCR